MRRNKRQFTRKCDWLTHILFWMSLMPLACNVCWAWLFVLGDMGMHLIWSIPREEKSLTLGIHFPTFAYTEGTIRSYLTYLTWPRWCLKGTSSANGPEPFSDTFDLNLAKSSSSPTVWGGCRWPCLLSSEERGKDPGASKDKQGRWRKIRCHLVLRVLTPLFLLFDCSVLSSVIQSLPPLSN